MSRAYFLQPKAAYWNTVPNWYNVAYLRSGTYKGMGQQDSSGLPSAQTLVNLPLSSPAAVDPYQYIAGTAPGIPTGGTTFSPFTNYLPWIIGGVLVVLILSGAGGRR
jgi:hypothetical protein